MRKPRYEIKDVKAVITVLIPQEVMERLVQNEVKKLNSDMKFLNERIRSLEGTVAVMRWKR